MLPLVRYLLEKPGVRAIIQKRLLCGLSRWWWNYDGETNWRVSCRGPLDMGTWVALIGLRLPGPFSAKNGLGDSLSRRNLRPRELRHIEILLVLLELPYMSAKSNAKKSSQSEGHFWGETLTVGEVLDQCYRLRVLSRPKKDDWQHYYHYIQELLKTLELLALWPTANRFTPCLDSFRELASMKLSTMWHTSSVNDLPATKPLSKIENFQCREMSLEMLRKVGHLEIQWTEYISEHLELDSENSSLKIFWFGFAAMASPIIQFVCVRLISVAFY